MRINVFKSGLLKAKGLLDMNRGQDVVVCIGFFQIVSFALG